MKYRVKFQNVCWDYIVEAENAQSAFEKAAALLRKDCEAPFYAGCAKVTKIEAEG
jgi:hypothetical protein